MYIYVLKLIILYLLKSKLDLNRFKMDPTKKPVKYLVVDSSVLIRRAPLKVNSIKSFLKFLSKIN